MSSSIPLGQCAASFPNYSGEQPRKADRLSQRTAFQVPHPDEWLMFGSTLLSISENLRINFLPSQPAALLASPSAPANLAAGHPDFLLQTVTRFLRPGFQHYYGFICHLTPLRSVSSLLLSFTIRSGCAGRNDMRLPQLLTGSCELPHPQTRHGSDQVLGVALFSTLTHPRRRIRFACAMCRSLPIASFRPCRCQQRPCDLDCLPLGRGDACFFQQAGVARFAGQTKNRFHQTVEIGFFRINRLTLFPQWLVDQMP